VKNKIIWIKENIVKKMKRVKESLLMIW